MEGCNNSRMFTIFQGVDGSWDAGKDGNAQSNRTRSCRTVSTSTSVECCKCICVFYLKALSVADVFVHCLKNCSILFERKGHHIVVYSRTG